MEAARLGMPKTLMLSRSVPTIFTQTGRGDLVDGAGVHGDLLRLGHCFVLVSAIFRMNMSIIEHPTKDICLLVGIYSRLFV
jgi:hypothetical protein